VDNILIYGKCEDKINGFIERMKTEDVALHKEGTAEGYLGKDIQRNGDTITFTQDGLTKRIIKALGLNTKKVCLLTIKLLKRILTACQPAVKSIMPA
jgi:hypothetical protein